MSEPGEVTDTELGIPDDPAMMDEESDAEADYPEDDDTEDYSDDDEPDRWEGSAPHGMTGDDGLDDPDPEG